jgi:invasion protein IalB
VCFIAAARSSAATLAPYATLLPEPSNLTHWTKLCSEKAGMPRICVVSESSSADSFAASAMLIEVDSTVRKLLRIIMPLGMDLRQGVSIVIDDRDRLTVPYLACEKRGCVGDFDASNLINRLRSGHTLAAQGIDAQGKFLSFVLSLSDFAEAYDGPPQGSN